MCPKLLIYPTDFPNCTSAFLSIVRAKVCRSILKNVINSTKFSQILIVLEYKFFLNIKIIEDCFVASNVGKTSFTFRKINLSEKLRLMVFYL